MSLKCRVYFWLAWMIFGGIAAALGGDYTETWTQWRGPQRNGQYEGITWPDHLRESNLKKKWSVPLSSSYSSPVVDLQNVYTTESLESGQEQVSAYRRETGDLVWTQSWKGSMKVPFFAASNGSWIRSTPALADGKLFVLGMQEKLVCLDASTGKQLWDLNIPKTIKTPEPSFGGVSSPMVISDHLYVQAGGGLIKVDIHTGRLIWTSQLSDDAMNQSPFASPRIRMLGKTTQIVVLGRSGLAGIDPRDGTLLWNQNVPAFRGMNILTPTFVGDSILTATYGGKTHLFTPAQTSENEWSITEAWSQKVQGYMSSPVNDGSQAYLHGRSGRLVCLNTETGNIDWTSSESLGKYCSMILHDNRILALSNDGKLRLIAANPKEYSVIDTFKVSDEDTWAHVAIADAQVFIRSLNALTIWNWEASSPLSGKTVAVTSN